MLKRLSMYCDGVVLRMVYFSLIHSKLQYGVVLWGGCSEGRLNGVFKMQKRAIRCLSRLKSRDSCREPFKSLGILTLPALYIFESIRYALQNNLIVRNPTLHGHNTRASANRTQPLPRVRLDISRKRPSYAGVRFFNALPDSIRNMDNTTAQIRGIKRHLIEVCPYSVNEYLQN